MISARFTFGLPAKCASSRWKALPFLLPLFLLGALSPAQSQSGPSQFCAWEHPQSLGEWYQRYRSFATSAAPAHFPKEWSDEEADFARLLWFWQRRLSGLETYEDSLEALQAQYGLSGEEAALAQPMPLLMGALSQSFLAREAALSTNPVPVIKRYVETAGYLKALRQYEDTCAVLNLLAAVYDACVWAAEDRLLYYPLVVMLPDAQEGGLKRLEALAKNSPHPFIRTEARYFLYKLHVGILEQEITGRRHLSHLAETYPYNPILQLEWAELLPASMTEERQKVRQRMQTILDSTRIVLDTTAHRHFRALWQDQQEDW